MDLTLDLQKLELWCAQMSFKIEWHQGTNMLMYQVHVWNEYTECILVWLIWPDIQGYTTSWYVVQMSKFTTIWYCYHHI